MRLIILSVLLFFACCLRVYSFTDTVSNKRSDRTKLLLSSKEGHQSTDSVQDGAVSSNNFTIDSISYRYLFPDPKRENKFLNALLNKNVFELLNLKYDHGKIKKQLKTGQIRYSKNPWLIETILGLLLYTGLLNLLFNKEIKGVLQSFYNNQILTRVEKDSAGINTWAFIGLFLLFNLSVGLVLYEVSEYKKIDFAFNGFRLFLIISLGVCLLFAFKFAVLKFLGLIFDINRLVSQYITIINLTYFNISFLLLTVGVCLSLLSVSLIPYLLYITILLIVVIFVWQYLGNSINVISNYRFHKFYLFIYLCALEISPILILIKALDI